MGYPLWHARLLLAHVQDTTWVVSTPDFDLYPEDISLDNDDLDGVVLGGPSRRVPAALNGEQVYRIRALSARELRDLRSEGEEIAAAERPAPAVGATPRPDLTGDPPDVSRSTWRILVPAAGRAVGDEHFLSASAKTLGDKAVDVIGDTSVVLGRATADESRTAFRVRHGLAADDGELDARVLPVFTRSDGERERTWESVCDVISRVELDSFGVTGPRTAHWCIRFLRRQQMHPEDYHRQWMTRHRLSNVDWGVAAHASALRATGLAGCRDQLDLPNLAVIEHLLREAQMVEYHYRTVEKDAEDKQRRDKKMVGPTVDESELFLGLGKSVHESMVCPELTEWIARQLERDANIQKQTRKAREERALARK